MPSRLTPTSRSDGSAFISRYSQLVSLSGSHTTSVTPFAFISPNTVSGAEGRRRCFAHHRLPVKKIIRIASPCTIFCPRERGRQPARQRRKNRRHASISDAQRDFLDHSRVGHFATADAGGAPHLIPVCFAAIGRRTLYITIDEKPKRRDRDVEAAPQHPRKSASRLCRRPLGRGLDRLGWVMLRGPAESSTPAPSTTGPKPCSRSLSPVPRDALRRLAGHRAAHRPGDRLGRVVTPRHESLSALSGIVVGACARHGLREGIDGEKDAQQRCLAGSRGRHAARVSEGAFLSVNWGRLWSYWFGLEGRTSATEPAPTSAGDAPSRPAASPPIRPGCLAGKFRCIAAEPAFGQSASAGAGSRLDHGEPQRQPEHRRCVVRVQMERAGDLQLSRRAERLCQPLCRRRSRAHRSGVPASLRGADAGNPPLPGRDRGRSRLDLRPGRGIF